MDTSCTTLREGEWYATVQVSEKCHFVLTLAAKQLTGEARVAFVQPFQFGDFHRQDTTLFDLSPRGFDREKVIHLGTCVGSSRVRGHATP